MRMILFGNYRNLSRRRGRQILSRFPVICFAIGLIFTLLLVSYQPSSGMGLCWFPPCDVPPPPPTLEVEHLQRIDVGAHGPAKVAVDSLGRFYITDPLKARIFITDARGQAIVILPTSFYPAGIAIGPDDKIYLGDVLTQAVYVWSAGGEYLFALGVGEGEFGWPSDIAVDQASGWVFVADSPANEVRVYDAAGAYLFSITGPDTDPLSYPTGVAVDPTSGNVVVSDHNNKTLKIFDLNGALLDSIGPVSRPQGVAVDGEGNIYVADAFMSKVYIFDPAGISLGEVGQYGVNPGDLQVPSGVALDPYGRLAVVSYNTGMVELFGPEGHGYPPNEVPPPTLSGLTFIDSVEAYVSFAPKTLNLSSNGRWVKVFIEPVGASAEDIDVSSILLNYQGDQVEAEVYGWALQDRDDNGIIDLKVLFHRESLVEIIDPSSATAEFIITGNGGSFLFEGTGSISITGSIPIQGSISINVNNNHRPNHRP